MNLNRAFKTGYPLLEAFVIQMQSLVVFFISLEFPVNLLKIFLPQLSPLSNTFHYNGLFFRRLKRLYCEVYAEIFYQNQFLYFIPYLNFSLFSCYKIYLLHQGEYSSKRMQC